MAYAKTKTRIEIREQTSSEIHMRKTTTLKKLAREVCPCCARGETLYEPTNRGGDGYTRYSEYHHANAQTCFASDLYKWGKAVGILFNTQVDPGRTPPK